ncbi:uncharacterized protein PAC_07127 [Phialocephala subalpina]|uniref:Uncharacterized protein n=1 Tax=Phialocephala subalpina TaxID=576137 RepID=A0A1L7WWT5_9HELO|nr:uncharacterized protein PAC_07127 [Phialocephala subalpina]
MSTMATTSSNRRNRYTTVYMPRRAPEALPKTSSCFEAACTHLTMTRFYTNNSELVCSHCGQPPANGWLWRCTQDRELILEDDADRGVVPKIDALPDIFEKPPPGPKSVAARQDCTSFTSEVCKKHLDEYSPRQIQQIIDQRIKVKQVANHSKFGVIDEIFYKPADDAGPNAYGDAHPKSSPSYKPWLPADECQIKWCQNCRPHGAERGWLSLNGIANGDLPLTAIYGFGFNFLGKRPVSLVKHVANLGLRPNPDKITNMRSTTQREGRHRCVPPRSRTTSYSRPNSHLGLGITEASVPASTSYAFTSTTPSSSSSQITRPRSEMFAVGGPIRMSRLQARLAAIHAAQAAENNTNTNINYSTPNPNPETLQPLGLMASTSLPSLVPVAPLLETPLSPTNGSFPPDVPFPPSPVPGRRHSFTLLPRLSVVGNIPLPAQTDEEIESISGPSSVVGDDDYQKDGGSSSVVTDTEDDIQDLTVSPNTDMEQDDVQTGTVLPITDMEEEEAIAGEGVGAFHADALKLKNGIAVLEESIEQHEADVIMSV